MSNAVVVSHEELVRRLAEPAPRAPCPHCGEAFKTHKGGLAQHIQRCPRNPERTERAVYATGRCCCCVCRLELTGSKRLALHHQHTHPAHPTTLPPTPPAAATWSPPPPVEAPPACGCGRPFARDLADPAGRCLACSGAYARSVQRRPTSYQAAPDHEESLWPPC